jgi:sulfate adenylyltransferase
VADHLSALGRPVRVLDGDAVRARFSPRLGFSRQDREANIVRIAHMACEAMENGEIAICACISPYRASRDQARTLIGAGAFIEVFVDTPLAVCEARDVKGLYRRARSGALTGFTGIDDAYETPLSPDVRLTTVDRTPEENVATLLDVLEQRWGRAAAASR